MDPILGLRSEGGQPKCLKQHGSSSFCLLDIRRSTRLRLKPSKRHSFECAILFFQPLELRRRSRTDRLLLTSARRTHSPSIGSCHCSLSCSRQGCLAVAEMRALNHCSVRLRIHPTACHLTRSQILQDKSNDPRKGNRQDSACRAPTINFAHVLQGQSSHLGSTWVTQEHGLSFTVHQMR